MDPKERDKLLLDISQQVGRISAKFEEDHKTIRGNGSPGLVQKVADLDKRLLKIEQAMLSDKRSWGNFWIAAAFVVNAAISLLGIIYNIVKEGGSQ
jgi:hypothetical protein